jgi:hypothetical protein
LLESLSESDSVLSSVSESAYRSGLLSVCG